VSAQPGKPPTMGAQKAKGKRRNRELARPFALVLLAVLIIVFAVVNLGQVKVDWIFGSGHAPLIIVIVISLVVGAVITHFTDRLSRWRK
jgi:uncharacterized integral membrane protein